MEKVYREISYQVRTVSEIEESILSQNSKNALVFVQVPTSGGKTTIIREDIKRFLKDNSENKCVIYFSPSINSLDKQALEGFELLSSKHYLYTTEDVFRFEYLPTNSVLVVGWASVDKNTNKLTLDKLVEYIKKSKADGHSIRIYIDECHLEADNVNLIETLRNKISIEAVIELSATLGYKDIDIISKSDKKDYFNFIYVDKQEVIDAGLMIEPVLINNEFIMEKAREMLIDNGVVDINIDNKEAISSLKFMMAATVFCNNRLNDDVLETLNNEVLTVNGKDIPKIPNVCSIIVLPHESSTKKDFNSKVNEVKKTLIELGVKSEEIAIYTAYEKSASIDEIKNNDSIHYVITKDALSTGFDCPRCVSLTKLKEKVSTWTYELQLLGRILRTPLGFSLKSLDRYDDDEDKIKSLVDELESAYVFTNSDELKNEIKNTYEKNAIGDIDIVRYDSDSDMNVLPIVKKAVNEIKFSRYEKDTTKYHGRVWNFPLSKLSNQFVEYVVNNSHGELSLIKTSNDVQSHNLNMTYFKESKDKAYKLDFSIKSEFISGISNDISKSGIKLSQNKKLNYDNVYSGLNRNNMKSDYVTFATLMGIHRDMVEVFLAHIFSSECFLSSGEYKLLLLSKIEFESFLNNNMKTIVGWAISFYNSILKDIINIEPNKCVDNLNLSEKSFKFYGVSEKETDSKLVQYRNNKKIKINYGHKGVWSDARESINSRIVPEEWNFEKMLNEYPIDEFKYWHNVEKHKPGYSIPYILESIHTDIFNKTNVVHKEYRNFFPDFLLTYFDYDTSTIYFSLAEIKHPKTLSDNAYDESDLKYKFKYMGEYVREFNSSNHKVVNDSGKVYNLKMSASIVRRDDSAEGFYVLSANKKYNEDYIFNTENPIKRWVKVKNVYEFINKSIKSLNE